MWNSFIRKALLVVLLGISLSTWSGVAFAENLPVLTWEAGKQQEITLTTQAGDKSWVMNLIGHGQSQSFSPSRRNSQGLMLYTIPLPADQQLGSYLIESHAPGSPPRAIAGVNIIKMQRFDVMQIPGKLCEICSIFLLLGTFFSTLRARRYSQLQYIRPKPRDSEKKYIQGLHRFRNSIINELNPSLLKFQIIKEGELLGHLSSLFWGLAPIVMFFLGALTGSQSRVMSGLTLTPLILYTLIGAIGVFDPFSGIAAAGGFFTLIAVSGSISNLNNLFSAITYSLGWFVPGLLASLTRQSIRHDAYIKRLPRAQVIITEIFSAIFGGAIFYVLELMTNSFTGQVGPIIDPGIFTSCFLTVVMLGKGLFEIRMTRDLHMQQEAYEKRVLNLQRVVAPQSAFLTTLYVFGAIYIWTSNLKFTFIASAIFGLSLSLLLIRFENRVFMRMATLPRHILLECSVAVGIGVVSYLYLSGLPFEFISKGEYCILATGLIFLLHSIYSTLHDSSHRNRTLVKQESLL
jgi:hypothetical protein